MIGGLPNLPPSFADGSPFIIKRCYMTTIIEIKWTTVFWVVAVMGVISLFAISITSDLQGQQLCKDKGWELTDEISKGFFENNDYICRGVYGSNVRFYYIKGDSE